MSISSMTTLARQYNSLCGSDAPAIRHNPKSKATAMSEKRDVEAYRAASAYFFNW